MEKHLQEFIEKLEPAEYDLELVQTTLDICAAYINQLEINYLQPVMDGNSNGSIIYAGILLPSWLIYAYAVLGFFFPCFIYFRSHST